MTCFAPIQGFQLQTVRTETGKKQITFNEKELKKNSYNKINLPCGRCIGCRIEKSRDWALRICHESQMHQKNSFLTLTYDDEHLNNFGSLEPDHFTLFIKKLRKRYNDRKIRYYQVGEYGEDFGRPHHHVCLFGLDWRDEDCIPKGQTKKKEITKKMVAIRNGDPVYVSDGLNEIWEKGNVEIGQITFKSAAYAARYVIKKITSGEEQATFYKTNEYGEQVNVLPEYATMSNRPGIGRSWVDMFKGDFFPKDYCTYKGKKYKTPSYYTRVLEEEDQEYLKYKRKLKGAQNKSEKTLARLDVKRRILQKKVKRLERNYENGSSDVCNAGHKNEVLSSTNSMPE